MKGTKEKETLIKEIAELKAEIKQLRETVAMLLDIVMEMRSEGEDEFSSELDAHETKERFSIYR